MAYKQVKFFDINKMGKQVGYCLRNVREGYGIAPKYADAKADMQANKAAGTLHDISTLPGNVAVPVYLDTNSPYEHIIVSDHGTFYSDGKRLTTLNGFKVFGWGESVNGVRVVEKIADPAPTPKPQPTGSNDIKVGDKVTLTKYVDYDGTALRKTREFYYVYQLNGDRAVLKADSMNGAVYAAVKKSNLRKV